MSLISSIKEKLLTTVIGRSITSLDAWGSKRWPMGWIKVRRAFSGWKFLVGWVVLETPDILNWFATEFPSVMSGVGLDTYTGEVVKGVGTVLMIVGLIHKWQKFTTPLERRDRSREETVGTTGVINPSEVVAPTVRWPMEVAADNFTKLENEVFLKEFNKRVSDGMPMWSARAEALQIVLEDRKKAG